MEQKENKKTPLYDQHIALGAKMVPFAGWLMPVRYSSIKEEHLAVRKRAGIFDVSHMGEIFVSGEDALSFLNWVTCNNVAKLTEGKAQYSAFLNEKGGVIDDIIVYCFNQDSYMICVNAANKDRDFAWLKEQGGKYENLNIEDKSNDYGQIALQGRDSQDMLSPILQTDLQSLKYFHFALLPYKGKEIIVARTGYTGEDGFEIFAENDLIVDLWSDILKNGGAVPCGLGARDSLRLEVCYPLHGHELSEDISALESGLGWIVKFKKGDFIGRDQLLKQKSKGLKRALAAFKMVDKGIAREGYKVYAEGKEIGVVTSGLALPHTLEAIGLALIDVEHSAPGSEIDIAIRKNLAKSMIVEKPFYKRDY